MVFYAYGRGPSRDLSHQWVERRAKQVNPPARDLEKKRWTHTIDLL